MKAKPELPDGQQPQWSAMTDMLANKIFRDRQAKGHWSLGVKGRPMVELACRAHAKLSKLFMAGGRYSETVDDDLPMYPAWQVALADVVIAVLEIAGAWNVPVGEIVLARFAWMTRQKKNEPY